MGTYALQTITVWVTRALRRDNLGCAFGSLPSGASFIIGKLKLFRLLGWTFLKI